MAISNESLITTVPITQTAIFRDLTSLSRTQLGSDECCRDRDRYEDAKMTPLAQSVNEHRQIRRLEPREREGEDKVEDPLITPSEGPERGGGGYTGTACEKIKRYRG